MWYHECLSLNISHLNTKRKWVSFVTQLLYSWWTIPQCPLSLGGSHSHFRHLREKNFTFLPGIELWFLGFPAWIWVTLVTLLLERRLIYCNLWLYSIFWTVLLCLVFSMVITLLTCSLSNRSYLDFDCISCWRIGVLVSLLKALLYSKEWSL